MKKITLLPILFCLVLLLTVTVMFSCKKSSSDNSVNLAGNWKGNLTSSDHSDVDSTTMVITQSGTNLTGPVSFSETDYSSTPAAHKSYAGGMTGTINGSNISITFTVTGPNGGTVNAMGTVNTAGNAMSGTYTSVGTSGTANTGNWSFAKQ
jgi:hypothetical protein